MSNQQAVQKILRMIDAICEWSGRGVSFFLIPLTLFAFLEVVMRYVFDRPTIWIWDVNIQIAAIIVVVGMGYGFIHGAYIRMDIVVVRLSPRKRAFLDLFTALLFFIGIGVLLRESIHIAWQSTVTREKWSSLFAPPIYPLKIVLALGLILLLLAGVAKFIRDLEIVFGAAKGSK